ncbi:LCP family glycopolymer transferase [Alkalibacillus aidingensis]|uniref:LCP family glycopolymer transferase n=1 Tax=Alkalibacillus aidingensis TaxID=2747607 RepID=UPI001660D015|nr:LCP family protein [Alkalibacillus aidingensis]
MSGSRMERKKQQQGRRTGIKIVIAILAVAIIAGGVYLYNIYNQVDRMVSTMYTPLDSDLEKRQEIEDRLRSRHTINVLLLGVDERAGDRGRSDTMVFGSLNPNTNKMLMFSIPRDTYVEIPGRGMDKINHAYAFGGSELSVQTVENLFDTTIHFYAKVNMEGLQDGVDALGGVTVYNDEAFSSGGYNFHQGELHLNGEEALAYSRMRKEDPRGDIGRGNRQQQMIDAMIEQGMTFESFSRVENILTAVGDNVETNMQMEEMRQMFRNYRGTRDETIREEISGTGQMMGNVWYYIVSEDEQNRMSQVIQDHMEAE